MNMILNDISLPAVIENDGEGEKKQRKFYQPGWYPDLSNDEYHSSFGWGSTTVKKFAEKTMAHVEYERSQPNTDTEALRTGQAFHTLTMEPHLFDKEFFVRPEGLKKPTVSQRNAAKPSASSLQQIKDFDQWESERGERLEISKSTYEKAKAMSEKVLTHPQVGPFFSKELGGIAEQSIYYWYNPEDWDEKKGYDYRVMCKVRPDWVIPGHSVLFDLKSARSAAFSDFFRDARKLKYHLSGAMYLDGANRCSDFLKFCGVLAFTRFVWIVCENEPPYEVAWYEMSMDDRERGSHLYHSCIRKIDLYSRSDWKGYGDDVDGKIEPTFRMSEMPNYGDSIV